MTLPDPPILVVTDRRQCLTSLETRAERLFRGGCRWLSIREKDLAAAERLSLLRRLIAIGRPFGACVGVHGDLEAARACGAALHLPAAANVAAARHGVGPQILLGQSCHTEDDMVRGLGADYVTLGPVFRSASKPGYEPSLSLIDLARILRGSPVPVLALGGVASETLPPLAQAGFGGIAVMGEAMRAAEPEQWFHQLAAQWRELRLASPPGQDAGGFS